MISEQNKVVYNTKKVFQAEEGMCVGMGEGEENIARNRNWSSFSWKRW